MPIENDPGESPAVADEDMKYGRAIIELSKQNDIEWQKRKSASLESGPPVPWASEAGKCSRAISYRMAGFERPPMDEIGHHVVMLGNLIHDAVQKDLPEEQVEVPFSIPGVVAGRADIVTEDEVVDLKSINSFGFKKKHVVVPPSHSVEGPDSANILQIGLAMRALGKPKGRVVYIAKESLDAKATRDAGLDMEDPARIALEYTFEDTPESVGPDIDKEIERLGAITELLAEGELAPRAVPGKTPKGARIIDFTGSGVRTRGKWVVMARPHGAAPDSEPVLVADGQTWVCGYCPYQQECRDDLDAQPVEVKVNPTTTIDPPE